MSGLKADPEANELDELFDYRPLGNEVPASSDDDSDYGQTAKRTPRRKPSSLVLDLGHILKAPRATSYSTKSIWDMIKDEIIDLEPEYQRGVVWPAEKQSAVIESIMRHYYVPPILLSMAKQDENDPTQEQRYVCIDGKQRISSICNFLENKIPVKEPRTGRRFWYKEDLGMGRTPALTAAQRRKFENEQLTIVEFQDLNEETERDMFSRVQMGVTLSSAEKLAAHLGEWPDFIREMVKRFIDPTPSIVHDDLGKQRIVVSRGKDYLFMAQIALLILNDKSPQYVPSAAVINTFLKDHAKEPPPRSLRQSMQRTLERYTALANHRKYGSCVEPATRLNSRGVTTMKPIAPAEFVYIAFLIYRFPQATVGQLYNLVEGIKNDVRPQFRDVFMNTTVATALRRYIDNAQLPRGDGLAPVGTSPGSNANGRKRARPSAAEEDDEEDDDDDLPHEAVRRRSNQVFLEPNSDSGLYGSDNGQGSSRNPLSNL
ncbi:hypothetical protein BCV70DRAFT_198306 [Testicularia cyperi]|uniref:GmrSD restriction endonucleases N-terminal domain-containing protein n=1 Tax=Testicularia cyperi TaxID=1882483 RepID=A0A317XUS2_9BASI|nr:hypothetical protein BCV70DRAFT_198306 [Testicularia cyperi]